MRSYSGTLRHVAANRASLSWLNGRIRATFRQMKVEIIDLGFQGVQGGIASFLVSGASGHLLIETGPSSTLPRLQSELQARGVEPRDLRAVFVTHIHLDHAGAAGWFAAQGVPLYVHPRGARHLVDPTRLVASSRAVYGDRFDPLWGEVLPAPSETVHSVADGSLTQIAGLEIRAIDTPGHAFHHHAYQIGSTLFTGDAAGARLDECPYLSLTSAPPQFHLEHTLSSIAKLRELHPERLFLTHFGEVSQPDEHFALYEETVRRDVEFVHHRLREGFDSDSLSVAYEAYQLECAFHLGLPPAKWADYQAINGTSMCADGIRMYWESRFAEEKSAKA